MPHTDKYALERAMEEAETYAEWSRAARAHDQATGKDKWKREEKTHLYDYAAIRERLSSLRTLRAQKDNHALLFTLNEGVHGNMAGMGSHKLYRQARFGTKKLITDYIDEVSESLSYIAGLRTRSPGFEERLEFFRRADHCFGRSALMLSGGGALGHFHVGVVKALHEQGVLPSVISGSSAGSVVAAIVGTHSDAELHEFFQPASLAMEARSDASWLRRIFTPEPIDVGGLTRLLERLVPDLTFEEAHARTGRQINVSIAPAERHQASRLLNSITSPNVFIREAVMASCALPGVYPSVMLQARNVDGERQPYLPSRRWVDGSVSEDMPAKRLARLYGVNHYIASQTNPLVLWFVQDPKARQDLMSTAFRGAMRTCQEWLRAAQPLTQKVVRTLPSVERAYNVFYSVATQDYTGDVNIFPRSRLFNPTRLLSKLTARQLMEQIREGEHGTWPRIEMIRNCSRIGRTLDQILHDYERRAIRYSHRRRSA